MERRDWVVDRLREEVRRLRERAVDDPRVGWSAGAMGEEEWLTLDLDQVEGGDEDDADDG